MDAVEQSGRPERHRRISRKLKVGAFMGGLVAAGGLWLAGNRIDSHTENAFENRVAQIFDNPSFNNGITQAQLNEEDQEFSKAAKQRMDSLWLATHLEEAGLILATLDAGGAATYLAISAIQKTPTVAAQTADSLQS